MTDLEVYEAALTHMKHDLPNLKNAIRQSITHLPDESAYDIRLKQLSEYDRCKANIADLEKIIARNKE